MSGARLVSVALPVAVDRGFTYACPARWGAAPEPGARVLVPFGSRGLVGVIRPAPAEAVEGERLREIHERLDPPERPALTEDLVALCEWISNYYVAPIGEVYRLALPGLMTGADARVVGLSEAGEALARQLAPAKFSEQGEAPPILQVQAQETSRMPRARERLLIAIAGARGRSLPVAKLGSIKPRIPRALTELSALVEAGLCTLRWSELEDERARVELHFRRTEYLRRSSGDEVAIARVIGRSKKRRALLDMLETAPEGSWVSIGELRGPFPRARALIKPLVAAGLVVCEERPRLLDPFASGAVESTTPQTPTEDQARALEQLRADVDAGEFAAALLHGITGSGKTEVYLQLIAHALEQGGGAIVLVPEIALTPQLSDRFRGRFGDTVAVLHSGLTPRQRLDAWQQIRASQVRIVIGARSAVFAPVPRLRVIVVDEEHDASFKQEDGVRYNARDVALVRARSLKAVAVLGSATPSLETYEQARGGRYRWLRLLTRPTTRPLPNVEVVPLSVHRPDPETMLSARLLTALRKTVAAGEQAILFLNRRGFATTLVCDSCGALTQCPDCSAPSMTYHLRRNRLMCHLCGHIEAPPERCKSCNKGELLHGNAGTERVELAVTREVEGAQVLRLDRDTSRGRGLIDTLTKFRAGEANVLVGTQMLSKGHDFPGVTLVGILQADHGLGLPDLRAAERTFQLVTQVAGRAGRGDRPGRVLMQAYAVQHPAVTCARLHDYDEFATWELARRRELGNPPFGHLALIRVSGVGDEAVQRRAVAIATVAQTGVAQILAQHDDADEPPIRLLGPVPSPIERINKRTRWQLLLRARTRKPLRWLLRGLRGQLGAHGSGASATHAAVDVDPQSLL